MPSDGGSRAGTLVTATVATAAVASAAAAAYAAYCGWQAHSKGARSTTAGAGGGKAAYETSKAVDEYLQMHFASADEVFPYDDAPKGAVNFCERCALLVEKHCAALRDFTGERPPPIALDVGCAVGGATFELTKAGFSAVLGVDTSRAFITAAETMQESGSCSYQTVVEGTITEQRLAQLPEGTDTNKAQFKVADACNLPRDLAPVDAILAANLLCRLPRPRAFLERLPDLLRPGGVVVLATPWSWLPAWTAHRHWIGGYMQNGAPVRSFDELRGIMRNHGFELRARENMPFVIREHARKHQWGCAHASVWVKPSQDSKLACQEEGA